MKIYEGGRHLEGATVTAAGRPLDPRFDLRTFSKAGFEWTYEGDGPRQLSLALLADHFGDDPKAMEHCERFMVDVVPISTTSGGSAPKTSTRRCAAAPPERPTNPPRVGRD